MTQEAVALKPASVDTGKPEPTELSVSQETKQAEKKKQMTIQELVESLKGMADDIGQISELSSEEKVLVAQFFSSFLKLVQPMTTSIVVNRLVLTPHLGDVVQAHIDPTGHLILQFGDGKVELKNLSEEKNRDLMIAAISDALPKFKTLTSTHKHKLEDRIKLLTGLTKEIQKSSEALSAAMQG